MNTHRLYELMHDLIEHQRMEALMHELVLAELDIKIGDVLGSHLFGKREVVGIRPVVEQSGITQCWHLVIEITLQQLKRNGEHSKKPQIIQRRTISRDWLGGAPETPPVVKRAEPVAPWAAPGDKALGAFVHGQALLAKKPDRRTGERRSHVRGPYSAKAKKT